MTRKVFIVGLTLFCLAVLISQLRSPKAENVPTGIAPTLSIGDSSSSSRAPALPLREARVRETRFYPSPQPRPISSGTRAVTSDDAPKSIEVEWKGQWYPATVLQSNGQHRLIHYTGSGDEWDEWVGPDRMRDVVDQAVETTNESDLRHERLPAPGDFVVKWGNRWWRAEVLDQKGDQKFIRYLGYGSEWDEWVTPERAKIFSETDSVTDEKELFDLTIRSHFRAEPTAPFEVEWNGSWWPANVLREENGKFLIHYEGYGDNSDEWVTLTRLRTTNRKIN